VNFDVINGYVLVAIGLFAVVFYVLIVYTGCAEFIARMAKNRGQQKRSKTGSAARRLRKARRSSSA